METFRVNVYINTAIVGGQDITLSNGNSTIVLFVWDTTGVAKGHYAMSAEASTIPNEIDISDNTFIDGIITVTTPGDVDGDFDVDVYDVIKMCDHYGYEIGEPEYDVDCDVDNDGEVDIYDVIMMCNHYGESYP